MTVFDTFSEQVHGNGSAARTGVAVDGINVIQGDVRDGDLIERALRASRARVVIHLAAETGTGQSHTEPAHYVDVNVTGTARLVEAIREVGGIRRVILSGTRAVYGKAPAWTALDYASRQLPGARLILRLGTMPRRTRLGAAFDQLQRPRTLRLRRHQSMPRPN